MARLTENGHDAGDALLKALGDTETVGAYSEALTRLFGLADTQGLGEAAASGGRPARTERTARIEPIAEEGQIYASQAFAALAARKEELGNAARWWMLNRGLNQWAEFGTRELLKRHGIYDADTVEITPVSVPQGEPTKLPPPAELMKLTGNVAAGKALVSRNPAADGAAKNYPGHPLAKVVRALIDIIKWHRRREVRLEVMGKRILRLKEHLEVLAEHLHPQPQLAPVSLP